MNLLENEASTGTENAYLFFNVFGNLLRRYCWQDVPFVNREQDLGEPGLRKAKLSYYPDHLEEKFQVRLQR